MKISNFKYQISKKLDAPARRQAGFTWPEIIVIMGIVAILFGFITINLFSAQHKASVNTEVENVVSDLKNQQTQAMTGSTEGRATADSYGVHFNTSSYVLFHGTTYNSADTTNFVINLDPSLQFSNITFPSSNIIFSQASGEVSGFVNGSNTIVIQSTQDTEQKTITINKYGVITGVQ